VTSQNSAILIRASKMLPMNSFREVVVMKEPPISEGRDLQFKVMLSPTDHFRKEQ